MESADIALEGPESVPSGWPFVVVIRPSAEFIRSRPARAHALLLQVDCSHRNALSNPHKLWPMPVLGRLSDDRISVPLNALYVTKETRITLYVCDHDADTTVLENRLAAITLTIQASQTA